LLEVAPFQEGEEILKALCMRTIVIGDIHGCSIAFDTLLEAIELQPADLVITLGDYVNHGPDSKGILDRLIELYQTGRLVPLRGNHELKMLAAVSLVPSERCYRLLLDQGTLASYGKNGQIGQLTDIPAAHWDFVQHCCVDWWETASHVFVHATLDPRRPLADQTPENLFWQKFDYPTPHCSGKTLICGHTSQKNGIPLNIGHAICLDTWAYGEGWLTGLEVESGRLWQANQAGQVREAQIDAFRVPGLLRDPSFCVLQPVPMGH
jgi:serine/threonine protein phosphatase 1